MLHIIYGNNRIQVQERERKLLNSLRAKRANAELFIFEANNFSREFFSGLLGGAGLFEEKQIVCVRYPKEQKDVWEYVFGFIPSLANSQNAFIFIESSLTADEKKELKKHAFAIEEYSTEKNDTKINLFPLANMIGKRDKKNAWVLYRKLIDTGVDAEEIFSIIFWQIKSLVFADKSKNAVDAGLKPFPFSSGKSFAKNFTDKERGVLIPTLVDIYHNTRRGGLPMELALEKFILNL